MAREIPLVGREDEMAHLVAGLARPAAAFVLAGEAGVGKTHLATQVARAATGLGYVTAHVAATQSAASIPFGPFARFVSDIAAASDDRLGLLHQLATAIVARARPGQQLLLVVDDAHLLDDGSAALVHQLSLETSCALLVSVRTPGPAPDPVTALWKDELAERIDLSPLSEREVEVLTSAVLGGPISGAAVRRLWSVTGGNPLYLRELLNGAVESGALAAQGGMWSLRTPLIAPDRLAELVGTRLAGLPPETIDVVELLAVGEPLGLTLLAGMTAPHALEEAEREGLIEVHHDGRRTVVRLAHPIYGEVLRQRLPRSRLHRLWAELARAVEATGARRQEDLLLRARWQLDAAGHGDPELLTRAARRAAQMFDLEFASRLAQAAFDSGGGVEAGLVLGESQFRSGQHEQAERTLAGLVDLCANDEELALVANARAYNFSNLMGDSVSATTVLDEALSEITDPMARSRLLSRLATNLIFVGEPEGALAATTEMLSSEDDVMIGLASYTGSIALSLLGRSAEAVRVAGRGLEAHRRTGQGHQLPEVLLVGAVLGHLSVGHFARAESDATTGYEACLRAGDREGQATFSLLLGWVRVAQGQLATAHRAFLEGASINRDLHDTGALRWCLGGMALAEGMAGHAGPATSALTELDELPPGWMTLFEAELIDRGRAWVHVADGEVSRALALLRAAATRAEHGHQWVAEANLLVDIARLGDPSSVADRLAALAGIIEGDLVTAFARYARALETFAASDLESAARTLDELGSRLLAAEAWASTAAACRADGLARRAAAATRRAEELLTLCGDVRTSAFPRRHDGYDLTRREREVAGLAATGTPSREIAERLHLSVRTVDNHLQSVFSKLGVTSRDELGGVLGGP